MRALPLLLAFALLALAIPGAAAHPLRVDAPAPACDLVGMGPACWAPWASIDPDEAPGCAASAQAAARCIAFICTADMPTSLCTNGWISFGFRGRA